jgi:hypothetical protein
LPARHSAVEREDVMRWVNGSLCVLMTLFAVFQYNDPDGVVWFLIYAVPAVWAGLAAFHPSTLGHGWLPLAAYGLSLAAAIAGSIYLWPTEIATWWDNEEVREGLGLIIVTVVLLIVGLSMLPRQRLGLGGWPS